MSNLTLQQSAISQLAAQADAVGKLAGDTGAFAATFAAFESNDPDAFRWVLQRLELLPRCELICEWIRVKLCGLRCFEVCGPLDPKVELPELPEFARALSQLASNEKVLRRVVDAVSCGDADSYQAAIAEVKLQRFCQLICRYVCSLYYRRICEVVCTGLLVPVSDPVLDIRADAEILSKVFANEKLTSVIGKAVIAFDCDLFRKEIERAGFLDHCEIICRVSCVWRSVWVCRAPVLRAPSDIQRNLCGRGGAEFRARRPSVGGPAARALRSHRCGHQQQRRSLSSHRRSLPSRPLLLAGVRLGHLGDLLLVLRLRLPADQRLYLVRCRSAIEYAADSSGADRPAIAAVATGLHTATVRLLDALRLNGVLPSYSAGSRWNMVRIPTHHGCHDEPHGRDHSRRHLYFGQRQRRLPSRTV